MSTYDCTTNDTWFEQYFSDRVRQLTHSLPIFLRAKYSSFPEQDHKDAVQEAIAVMWKRYSEDPEHWAGLPQAVWNAYAFKVVTSHMMDRPKRYRDAEQLFCELVHEGSDEDPVECAERHDHKNARHYLIRNRGHYATDDLLDLDQAIRTVLRGIPSDYHRENARNMLVMFMEGFEFAEIGRLQGWAPGYTYRLWTTLKIRLRAELADNPTPPSDQRQLSLTDRLLSAICSGKMADHIRRLKEQDLCDGEIARRVGADLEQVRRITKSTDRQYTEHMVAEIHRLRAEGLTQKQIAERINGTRSGVGKYLREEHSQRQATYYAEREARRQAIHNCRQQGMRADEIAALLDISLRTVYNDIKWMKHHAQ